MKNFVAQLGRALLASLVLLGCTAYGQITPSADSYTNTADPTTNYGANTLLGVESASQTAYIRFDLSAIPSGYSGANITKASLKLYVNSVTTAGSFNVDYVNGTWVENKITADLAPALGSTIAASVPLTVADKNQYILIDITSAVQAWLSGTANDGIALVANSPLNATFDSKESTTTSHASELDIVFAEGSGGGITGITTANGSGLIGGGTSGNLSLSLTHSCTAKQTLQWSGSAWACASPSGSGTVTSVGSGAGLTGGPITGAGTLSITTAGVSNNMLANSSLKVSPGTGLTGGGSVALGGSTTLNLDTTKVPLLASANTFAANQTVNGTVMASSATIGVNGVSISSTGAGVLGQGPSLSSTALLYKGQWAYGVWGDTAANFSSGAFPIGVLGTADDDIAVTAHNSGANLPSLWSENDTNTPGGEVFYGVLPDLELGAAIIGDAGCGAGPYLGFQLGQGGMSSCNNYTLLGDDLGNTYINAGGAWERLTPFSSASQTTMLLVP